MRTSARSPWTASRPRVARCAPSRPAPGSASRAASAITRPDRFQSFLAWARDAGVETELGPDDWPHARIGAPAENNPVVAATRELASTHAREEFIARAHAGDLMCLPIADFRYMERHPHFLENRQFLEVQHERLGPLGFVRSPVDAMAREIALRRAPALGEHSREVLRELGVDDRELERLRARGVIGP
jgi:crotonobetainyl-CoA:carnitine CoA-transferase CaiB-like acyl-CoA transferase